MLNQEQTEALQSVVDGKNTFITGPAGTGKSHLINHIKKNLITLKKTFSCLAPTGVAAINVNGETIHRFLGMRPNVVSISDYVKFCKNKMQNGQKWRRMNVMLIDEISMVHPDFFELVSDVAKYHRRNNHPFGGVQVVLIGDFYQLSPISKNSDREFVFESKLWGDLLLNVHSLSVVMRQESLDFIKALADLRVGRLSNVVEEMIIKCSNNKVKKSCVYARLFALNKHRHLANEIQLAKINSQSRSYKASESGDLKYLDGCRAESIVILKVGCPVMLLWNMPNFGLYNGSIGVVTKLDDFPVVRWNSGIEAPIEQQTWEIIENFDGNSRVIASRTQFPLALAYALTVHKTQGLTLDHLEIDLSDVFAFGQMYVAMSRARDPDNLIIKNFDSKFVTVNPKVTEFYDSIK
jgi:ATP-dependent DNA helicase PIF1